MQVSLSPETAALLKTELAAISTTYLNLSMPSWGTNTATPRPILGHVSPQLDRRAIQSNIAFTPEDQAPIHCSGQRVDTAHLQRYRGVMIRGYDTSALHWKDEILRIRRLEAEIADMQKEIDRLKREALASEERSRRFRRWGGV